MNENVVKFISEGLLNVIENVPENPIDFLAKFLFEKSLEVPNSDPRN